MSEAREKILATLRSGLKRGSLEGARRAELEARLANPPRHIIPARALLPQAEQVALFVQMAQEAAASVDQVAEADTVPAAVANWLARERLPMDIVLAPAEELTAMPWEGQATLAIQRRRPQNGDKVSVTPAFAGIAETGTLMLLSGPPSPTALNFLPDVHIVVLWASQIVGPYEDAWAKLRQRDRSMPRTVNFITGPSRSGDIEMTLHMGAHGPGRLHMVLVGVC